MELADDVQQYWKTMRPRLQQMITEVVKNRASLQKKINYLDHYMRHASYPNKEKAMNHIDALIQDVINNKNNN
jgi:hypothetical protein